MARCRPATRSRWSARMSPLLNLIKGGRLDPTVFVTHRFALADAVAAYGVFAAAAATGALKVTLKRAAVVTQAVKQELVGATAR